MEHYMDGIWNIPFGTYMEWDLDGFGDFDTIWLWCHEQCAFLFTLFLLGWVGWFWCLLWTLGIPMDSMKKRNFTVKHWDFTMNSGMLTSRIEMQLPKAGTVKPLNTTDLGGCTLWEWNKGKSMSYQVHSNSITNAWSSIWKVIPLRNCWP